MKTLSSTVAFQDEAGNALANGSIILTLASGVYEIAAGGGQVVGQSVIVNLDATGKISGTPQVWASDELTPQVPYTVTICGQKNGLGPIGYATWLLAGSSPIDLSQMVSTVAAPFALPGVVMLAPAAGQTIVQPTGTSLSVNRFENIRFADQFAGASVGAQIDAACADIAGLQGLVIIPSSMGAGNSLVGIPDSVAIWDLRGLSGPNEFGNEGQSYLKDNIFRRRWTAALNTVQNYQVLHIHGEPFSGGINTNPGTKTNYSGITTTLTARTPGQHNGFNFIVNNFSHGDTIGLVGEATSWGNESATGDEGTEGLTVQANQGSTVMTGTISAVVGNTLTFSPITNANTLGEQRPLINTSRSVYSTGTVSGIAGTPPTVTGAGTAWAAQFGAGAKTNLFFSLDADANGGLKLCVPVRSITDDTHLVLDYVSQGADAVYPTSNTGTYKIFQGSKVAGVVWSANSAFTGVTVGDGTQFSVGDTVEQPLGYALGIVGAHITINPQIQGGTNTGYSGILLQNNGAAAAVNANNTIAMDITGPWGRGIQFTGAISGGSGEGLLSSLGAVGAGGIGPLVSYSDPTNNAVVTLIRTVNNASSVRDFKYDRQNDQWVFGSSAASFSASDTRVAFGTNIQATTAQFLFYSNVAWDGLTISGPASPNNGVFTFRANNNGIPNFYVKSLGSGNFEDVVNNSVPLVFYSGNQSGEKARIASATGLAEFARVKTDKGTALVAGDFALSAGFGTTATVTGVIGTDQGWTITVTSSGTGQAANPTITLTFHDGTWTNSPITISKMSGGTGAVTQLTESPTATTNVITFQGTPSAGSTYVISSIAMGR